MRVTAAVANARMNQIEGVIGASGKLRLYTGDLPTGPAGTRTGTMLAEFALPASFFLAAALGAIAKDNSWTAVGANNGFVGYYTFFDNAGTTSFVDGLVGETWRQSAYYSVGQCVNANGKNYRCTVAGTSAGTGTGPSHTTGTATDSGVTWQYRGLEDMTMDNSDVAVNQALSAGTMTLTDGDYVAG